ncbi:MAG: hypothetical protein COV48_09920, partial [Elusimicrobia bacterium CG11_big_fil_rev_8_21_14_0_20_64_6]
VRAAERGAAGALEVRRNDARTGELGEAAQPLGEAGQPGEDPAEEGGELLLEIEVEHVPKLAHLFREQPARNVALVMPHLKQEVRNAYLSAISREAASEVLLAMAPMRFVDPELLRELKAELERRVRGVVGGP